MSRYGDLLTRRAQPAPVDANLMIFNAATGLWTPAGIGGDATMTAGGGLTLNGGPFNVGSTSGAASLGAVGSLQILTTGATIAYAGGSRKYTFVAWAGVAAYPLVANVDSDFIVQLDISVDNGATYAGAMGTNIKGHYNSQVGASNHVAGIGSVFAVAARSSVAPTNTIRARLQVNQGVGATTDVTYQFHVLLAQLPSS